MSSRTCPHTACAELNDANAVVCSTCGTRLVPDHRTLERWMRVRGSIQHVAAGIDPDEIANQIVADLETRHLATKAAA